MNYLLCYLHPMAPGSDLKLELLKIRDIHDKGKTESSVKPER